MLRLLLLILLIQLPTLWASVCAQNLQDAIGLQFNRPDSAIVIANSIATSAEADDKLRSNAFEVVGIALMVKGELRESFDAHTKALKLRETLEWHGGIGHSLNNMGLASSRMGDLAGAMELFLRSLSIAELNNDSVLMTRIYGNIGTLYEEQREYDRALEYYERSLRILEKREDRRILGNTLHNIAVIYGRKEKYPEAIGIWKRTLAIRTLDGDQRGTAHALHNFGSLVYASQRKFHSADSLYALSLTIYESLDDRWGMSMVLGSMGQASLASGRLNDAISQCHRSLTLAEEVDAVEYEISACRCLADAYTLIADHRLANIHLNRLVYLRDSISESDSGRKAALMEQRYAHEKAQLLQRTIAEEEIKRQHLLRNMSVALGMMGILLFLVQFNSYRKKLKANELLEDKNVQIEASKEQLAHKNREVTDSIQYAKRLQDARLPRTDMFLRFFSACHVIYWPKDIVSGDFYWVEQLDGHILVAVADCTGHGVPGAMVSMVGIHGLNRAVLEQRLSSPATILNLLDEHVRESFNKRGDKTVSDGMDMALCVISPDRQSLTFSGANNSLWQISHSAHIEGAKLRESQGGLHLHEWKADRRSIGGFFDSGEFTEHIVPILPNDTFVMFSDGYADQFGGERGRKLGSARFRQLALSAAASSDFASLDRHLTEWMGQEEQVDDVSVVCFRV